MNTELKEKLPKELLECTDINIFRSLKDWADTKAHELEKEKQRKEIDKYRPDIEGKFLRKYGSEWNGPRQVVNTNDIYIVYIKKIDFVGHGFLRCDAVVFNVKHASTIEKINNSSLSVSSKEYDDIRVATWHDTNYDISFESAMNPDIIDRKEVEEIIDKAIADVNSEKTVFWKRVES